MKRIRLAVRRRRGPRCRLASFGNLSLALHQGPARSEKVMLPVDAADRRGPDFLSVHRREHRLANVRQDPQKFEVVLEGKRLPTQHGLPTTARRSGRVDQRHLFVIFDSAKIHATNRASCARRHVARSPDWRSRTRSRMRSRRFSSQASGPDCPGLEASRISPTTARPSRQLQPRTILQTVAQAEFNR